MLGPAPGPGAPGNGWDEGWVTHGGCMQRAPGPGAGPPAGPLHFLVCRRALLLSSYLRSPARDGAPYT